jgi:hypothetical protein
MRRLEQTGLAATIAAKNDVMAGERAQPGVAKVSELMNF